MFRTRSAALRPLLLLHRHQHPHRRSFISSRHAQDIFSNGWTRSRYLAILALLSSATATTLAVYSYTTSHLPHLPSSYPPAISTELRKALYYSLPPSTNPNSSLGKSVSHFRAALEKCGEEGLDPTSDEVTGIKVELAGALVRFGMGMKGVEVLEGVLDEVVSAAAGGGGVAERDRRRLLRRGVAVAAEVSRIYADMGRMGQAEEPLVWAVGTAVAESRGGKEGGEGEWLSGREVAMVVENLAALYEATDRFSLAGPLWLLALEHVPEGDCHSVVLMNNLAASLAQQHIEKDAPVTREQLVEGSATPWAQKALKLAESIGPPERTEECDVGCVVARHNLAEFAEMLGDRELARRRYLEAMAVAKGLGIVEGVERAEEGLKRVEGGA